MSVSGRIVASVVAFFAILLVHTALVTPYIPAEWQSFTTFVLAGAIYSLIWSPWGRASS